MNRHLSRRGNASRPGAVKPVIRSAAIFLGRLNFLTRAHKS
jgi:hypothetical protein